MIGEGTEEEQENEAPQKSATSAAPLVLDDSDCDIPDEWGLNEAYKADDRVVRHGENLYIAGTHTHRGRHEYIAKVPSTLYAVPTLQHYIFTVRMK